MTHVTPKEAAYINMLNATRLLVAALDEGRSVIINPESSVHHTLFAVLDEAEKHKLDMA